jgi:hypothetical protein
MELEEDASLKVNCFSFFPHDRILLRNRTRRVLLPSVPCGARKWHEKQQSVVKRNFGQAATAIGETRHVHK